MLLNKNFEAAQIFFKKMIETTLLIGFVEQTADATISRSRRIIMHLRHPVHIWKTMYLIGGREYERFTKMNISIYYYIRILPKDVISFI